MGRTSTTVKLTLQPYTQKDCGLSNTPGETYQKDYKVLQCISIAITQGVAVQHGAVWCTHHPKVKFLRCDNLT